MSLQHGIHPGLPTSTECAIPREHIGINAQGNLLFAFIRGLDRAAAFGSQLRHGEEPRLSRMSAQRLYRPRHTAHQTCGYSRKCAPCSWRSASLHEIIRGPSSRSVHTSTTTRPSSQPRLTSRISPYSARVSSRVSIGPWKTGSHSARSISCLLWFFFRLAGSQVTQLIAYTFNGGANHVLSAPTCSPAQHCNSRCQDADCQLMTYYRRSGLSLGSAFIRQCLPVLKINRRVLLA